MSRVNDAIPAPSATPPAAQSGERLLAEVRQLAGEAHPGRSLAVSLDSSFERDLALDSLARVELMLRVGKAFDLELPAEALSQADTPRALLRFLGESARSPAHEPLPALDSQNDAGFPAQAHTLVEALEWHAARQPERVHILLHDEQHRETAVTYRALLDAARTAAAGLVARGLQPGQAVALMLPTGRDYLASFFGAMIAGGIPVPIYPPARMSQIEEHLRRHARILTNAGAAFIVTVAQAKPVAVMLQAQVPCLAAIVTPQELATPAAAPHPVLQGGHIAFLQYTSGSTGDPKGVVLTHANLLANIRALGQVTQVTSQDVFVSWLPLYHDMGLIGAWFGSLYHGIPLVLMSPLTFLARPALWLEALSRHRGSISAAPNFAYELCVRHVPDAALEGLDLSCWRLALNGAEPVSPATIEAFAERFARCGLRREAITPVYGLAESSVGLAFPPLARGPRIDLVRRDVFDSEARAVPAAPDAPADTVLSIPSCGRPLPGHAIRIADEAGCALPERRIGRLEFRGPSATSGYYRNPEATARLMRDGWLDSGDYAYMAEGEVHITGRIKDLIKRGGRNIYPYDLEQAVGNLPGIRKGCVAVFGSRDPAAGAERLVVMAETRERDAAARAQLCRAIDRAAVEASGAPADDIVLVPAHAVLKTSSGKIRRGACRQAYERGETGQGTTGAAAPWRQKARLAARMAGARVAIAARRLSGWAYGGYAWTVFALLTLCCGALAALLRRPAAGRRIARMGAKLLFRLAGVSVRCEGLDRLPPRPHVLLVNHASYLDAVLLTALLPPNYVYAAKQEFVRQPLMRTLLASLGTLFVDRFDATRGAQNVELMAQALARGENLVVFPEGTFSRENGLRPFHSGALLAAATAGTPVVAAGLRGTRSALRAGSWWPRRAVLQLEIGHSFLPAGRDWSAAARLSADTRAEIAQLSGEFALPD